MMRSALASIYVGVMALLLGVALAVPTAQAQPGAAARTDSAIIRGTVIDQPTGLGLPYAIVSIPTLGLERFANEQGQFTFQNLREGSYRLRVRALGHTPVELDVTVGRSAVEVVRITMVRIVARLAAMQVKADWQCTDPGRPDRTKAKARDSATIEVFEQLEQNAQRLRLIAKEFPFELDIERQFYQQLADGTGRLERADTIVLGNRTGTIYERGKVVVDVQKGAFRETVMQLPTLLDFADAAFQKNHCFVLRGVDDSTGTALLRVDFKAAKSIKTPDVNGSVYLDPTTYALRRTRIDLSAIPKGFVGLQSVRVTTTFTDLQPGLPIVGMISALNEFVPGRYTRVATGSLEQQTPIQVRFLKGVPGGK